MMRELSAFLRRLRPLPPPPCRHRLAATALTVSLRLRSHFWHISFRSALSGLVALPVLLAAAPAFALGKDVRKAMKE